MYMEEHISTNFDGNEPCYSHSSIISFWSINTKDGCDTDGYHKNKAKRVRTTFTEEQLQVLQANFQIDSNPDGQDLERIASVTGLSKRVTQVWFQNSRARQKKHIHAGKTKSNIMCFSYQYFHLNNRLCFLFSFIFQINIETMQSIWYINKVPRDADGNSYGRHINLQLTYSFQNNSHNSLQLSNNNNNNNINNNNNNNGTKSSLFTNHGNFGTHNFF